MHFGNAKQNVRKRQNAFWRTFSKGKCSAVQKCIWCKNAFDAKMHLMLPLHFVYKMLESGKMHLMLPAKAAKCILATQRVHFPKENVQLCKNAFLHHILRSKMFSITFDFVKCSASHFPKENVQQNKMLQMHLMLPLHFVYKMLESGKMHFGVHFLKENVQRTFDFVKCDAKQNVTNAFDAKMHFGCAKMHLMPKCIWCVHFVGAKMHLMQKCIWCVHFVTQNVTNAFDATLTFCLQNVRKRQNAFWRTFSKGKCSAYIFQRKMFSVHLTLENVQLCKNAFDAYILLHKLLQMHLMRTFCNTKCYKCIWCKNAFLQRNAYILRSKMFSITLYFVKCSASHFPKENVQQNKMLQIPFWKGVLTLIFWHLEKNKKWTVSVSPLLKSGVLHLFLSNKWTM